MKYTFLLKIKDSSDRDCVVYIDLEDLKQQHFDITKHFNVCGANFSSNIKMTDDGKLTLGSFHSDSFSYTEIKTVLSEAELTALANPGGETVEIFERIINRLTSTENKKLFNEVQQEEIDYIYNEYAIEAEEVEKIWNQYDYYGYRDRGIIGCVFGDAYDCGYEEAFSLGIIPSDGMKNIVEKYFDFEEFGNDLAANDENYYQLSDDRIVLISL